MPGTDMLGPQVMLTFILVVQSSSAVVRVCSMHACTVYACMPQQVSLRHVSEGQRGFFRCPAV